MIKVKRFAGNGSIKWKFNPPAARNFGGVFEVMVKAAKRAVYAVLCGSYVTDKELITACTGVENVDTTSFNPTKRRRKIEALISHVWSRWLKECLPTLRKRPKWNQIVEDLKTETSF